jgi:beta-hydroxyacyl-ACP dehydratase FabZ
MNIPLVLDRLSYRYPVVLVDAVMEHEPGRRIVAVKNVTVNEEYFQGHFPGTPLMPGVLMIESLVQVATLLLADGQTGGRRAWLRGVDNAKFRRQVVPGDRLELAVTLGRRHGCVTRAAAAASVDGQTVAEADLIIVFEPTRRQGLSRETAADGPASIHETAILHPGAMVGEGSVIGPYASIGAEVRIGKRCRIGASSIVDGCTEIGDDTLDWPRTAGPEVQRRADPPRCRPPQRVPGVRHHSSRHGRRRRRDHDRGR